MKGDPTGDTGERIVDITARAVSHLMSLLSDAGRRRFERLCLTENLLRRCWCGGTMPANAVGCGQCGSAKPKHLRQLRRIQ